MGLGSEVWGPEGQPENIVREDLEMHREEVAKCERALVWMAIKERAEETKEFNRIEKMGSDEFRIGDIFFRLGGYVLIMFFLPLFIFNVAEGSYHGQYYALLVLIAGLVLGLYAASFARKERRKWYEQQLKERAPEKARQEFLDFWMDDCLAMVPEKAFSKLDEEIEYQKQHGCHDRVSLLMQVKREAVYLRGTTCQ